MESAIGLIQLFWADLQNGQLPELGPWNYVLLSLLIVVQGPLATLLGGAAASAGLLRPSLVFVAGIAGNLTADILWFTAGSKGKIEWVLRFGHRLGVRKDHLHQLQHNLHRHSPKILLLAKLSAGLAVPALIAAGLCRIRWRRWFPVVFVGETIWTGTLLCLGFFAAEAIKRVEQQAQGVTIALTIALVLLLLSWSVPRALRHSKSLADGPADRDIRIPPRRTSRRGWKSEPDPQAHQ